MAVARNSSNLSPNQILEKSYLDTPQISQGEAKASDFSAERRWWKKRTVFTGINGLEEGVEKFQKVDPSNMVTRTAPFQLARLDSKVDRTERAARELICDEMDARQEKTERLKAERLKRIAAGTAPKKSSADKP
ncbi:hypothetical protein [uncultured Roseovarius sp.]|uniref:hypothetical protein n=1 Tax=uncultured Roseovarius sp. TaxID=293344 RepID=UPI002608C430|nr:hypothetical protein [uncultured Roseovarius sp.]